MKNRIEKAKSFVAAKGLRISARDVPALRAGKIGQTVNVRAMTFTAVRKLNNRFPKGFTVPEILEIFEVANG